MYTKISSPILLRMCASSTFKGVTKMWTVAGQKRFPSLVPYIGTCGQGNTHTHTHSSDNCVRACASLRVRALASVSTTFPLSFPQRSPSLATHNTTHNSRYRSKHGFSSPRGGRSGGGTTRGIGLRFERQTRQVGDGWFICTGREERLLPRLAPYSGADPGSWPPPSSGARPPPRVPATVLPPAPKCNHRNCASFSTIFFRVTFLSLTIHQIPSFTVTHERRAHILPHTHAHTHTHTHRHTHTHTHTHTGFDPRAKSSIRPCSSQARPEFD